MVSFEFSNYTIWEDGHKHTRAVLDEEGLESWWLQLFPSRNFDQIVKQL